LDQIYVREHPNCLFWRVFLDVEPLDAAPPEGDRQDKPASTELDFLPSKALPRQMKHIKSFYQRDDDEIKTMMARPMIYLSKDEMDFFVSNATERIYDIYQMLWPTPPALNGKFSALELAES
jgi:hypothetical protein